MTALRFVLLVLFVRYCRASGGECDPVDRTVSIPCTRINLMAHFEITYIILVSPEHLSSKARQGLYIV